MKKINLLSAIILFSVMISNGQEVPSYAEIYNFEPGDEFQIYSCSYFTQPISDDTSYFLIRKIVESKSFVGDSLFYSLIVDSLVCDFESGNPAITDTVSLANIVTLVIPDTTIGPGNNNVDTMYSDPGLYNGRKIIFCDYSGSNVMHFCRYTLGCGVAWDLSWDSWIFKMHFDSLFYFRKGNEEWGTRIVSGLSHDEYAASLMIYPNPANTFIEMITLQGLTVKDVIIYTPFGQKVLHLPNPENRVNISLLDPGLYIIEVNCDKKRFTSKLIVK
jgi:hypothetical protein